MAVTLDENQEVKRIVYVYGVGDCELTIARDGMFMRIPGSRLYLACTWQRAVDKAFETPSNVPCFMAGDGKKLLEHEKTKVEKSRAKRELKKEKKC